MSDDRDETDEHGIQRTLARYCQLCDDGHFDEWADLFVEDATLSVMGRTYEGRDAIKAMIVNAMPPERRGKHFLGQSVADVGIDSSLATAVTDFSFIARDGEGRFAITNAGRYHDTLVRAGDGCWRFRSREIRFLGES